MNIFKFLFILLIIPNVCFANINIEIKDNCSEQEIKTAIEKTNKLFKQYGFSLTRDVNIIFLNRKQYKVELIKKGVSKNTINELIKLSEGVTIDNNIYVLTDSYSMTKTIAHELTHQLQYQLIGVNALKNRSAMEGFADYVGYIISGKQMLYYNHKIQNIKDNKDFISKGEKFGYVAVYEQSLYDFIIAERKNENIVQRFLRLTKE